MKSFKVAFICLTVCSFALTVLGFTKHSNHLLVELTPLSENEMVSTVGAWYGQACDGTGTCPDSVSCSGVSCQAVPDGTGGYRCVTNDDLSGCSESGSYDKCTFAWCWHCDADGNGGACGEAIDLGCYKDLVGGCYCDGSQSGDCRGNCSD